LIGIDFVLASPIALGKPGGTTNFGQLGYCPDAARVCPFQWRNRLTYSPRAGKIPDFPEN
jgi:hypothetical protein